MVGTGRARFVGTFEHTLDDKGRLILPASFRPKLAEGAFVTAFDHCLAILPPEEFDDIARRFEERIETGEVEMGVLRSFAAQADEVMPDTQGRVRLLPALRQGAGLERQVIVVGALSRIEVWSPERWEAASTAANASLASAIERGHGLGPRT